MNPVIETVCRHLLINDKDAEGDGNTLVHLQSVCVCVCVLISVLQLKPSPMPFVTLTSQLSVMWCTFCIMLKSLVINCIRAYSFTYICMLIDNTIILLHT